MIENKVFTRNAINIINKKLNGRKLSQQDSNYLSRFVRPKLREIAGMDAKELLRKLDYNPRALSIEGKIRKIILDNLKDVEAIILCGSAIQTNYRDYNDIDVIVATKKPIGGFKEKNKIIDEIRRAGLSKNINLDVQIYAKRSILEQYPHNPSLIYQLKDSKVIYGELKLPDKFDLSAMDLRMKLDWSDVVKNPDGRDIYYALRNTILVSLLMNGKIDNALLKQNIESMLGSELISRLMNNAVSLDEKKMLLVYINSMLNYLRSQLKEKGWERIEILKN